MPTYTSRITPKGRTYALIGGIIGFLTVLTVRFIIGSPRMVIHALNAGGILPPLWLLSLIWFAFPTQCGLSAGLLLSRLQHAAEREAIFWRGCTALVLSFMCAAAWYALLFGKCSLIISGICLMAAIFLSVLCAISWSTLSGGAGLIMAGNALWYTVLLLLQIAVALRT